MYFDVPPLPYDKDALEPHISEENLTLHYDRQINYIKELNATPYVSGLDRMPLEQIILNAIDAKNEHLYNVASQAWNHAFFFNSLKEDGGGPPSDRVGNLIKADFGGFDSFKRKFAEESKDLFGSGWQFFVYNPSVDRSQIFIGKDAESPFPFKLIPIFCIDLWEHSFQCDFGNDRVGYVNSMLDNLVNWDFANDNCRRSRL